MDVFQDHQRGKIPEHAGEEAVRQPEQKRKLLLPWLIYHRRGVVAGAALLMIFVEVIENLVASRAGNLAHLIFDIIVYIAAVPAVIWLLLNLLERSVATGEEAAHDSDLQAQFSQRLGSARGWDELVREILEFTRRLLPGVFITLFIVDPQKQCLQAEAAWPPEGQILYKPQLDPAGALLPNIAACPQHGPKLPAQEQFLLPLQRGKQQVGVIKVEFSADNSPPIHAVRLLEGALPTAALALDAARLEMLAARQATAQAEAADIERQKIAQNLHDSLAQNISYLRFKLDQLTGQETIREIGFVLQELERMRASAEEAYQQVRETIDDLTVINGEDLAASVEQQARIICVRAGLNLRATQTGTPHPLPAQTRQHILHIAREALHNIEKHAGASLVRLQFLWLEGELILKITDDGVGFHPLSVPSEGHYGLWIMKQRAQDIGGAMKITPADEHGTEITLWVPYPGWRE